MVVGQLQFTGMDLSQDPALPPWTSFPKEGRPHGVALFPMGKCVFLGSCDN